MREKNGKKIIRDSLLCGMLCSVAVSLLWFSVSVKARDIGVALILLGLVAFMLWFSSLLLLKKAGKVRKIISLMLVTAINFCAYFSVSVYYLIPTQLFYPSFNAAAYEQLQMNPIAEEINIQTEDGILSGWFLKTQQGRAPLIIYYGGNADNASDWVERFPSRSAYAITAGCNFVMVDYPGYGRSDGKICDEAIRSSSLAVYDAMASRADVDEDKIIIYGFSLGTGAANYVASRRNVAGLILSAPYADSTDLINRFVPIFYGPLEKLISYRMPSYEYADKVKVKVLLFASPDDETVAYSSSQRLSEVYNSCTFVRTDGLKHNDFWNDAQVISRVCTYIEEMI